MRMNSRFRYSKDHGRVVLPEMKEILLTLKVRIPRPAETQMWQTLITFKAAFGIASGSA